MKRLVAVPAGAAIVAIRLYRAVFGGILPQVCRFEPSCSRYAEEAISQWGLVRGGLRAVGRLLRCHPFHRGGYDPVRKR